MTEQRKTTIKVNSVSGQKIVYIPKKWNEMKVGDRVLITKIKEAIDDE